MKILLLGKDGQVGWELQRSLAPLGDLVACDLHEAPPRTANLAEPESLTALVHAVRPDLIVNAAAYTAVDRAESEPALARTVNAVAPAVLAREAKALDALLVHYSTDYVFDGSGEAPRDETAATAPLSSYGRTKLEGEQAIAASGCRHLIFRTSWVHAARGGNFVRTMLRLAVERDALKVVSDQIGAPTGAELLADVTAHAIRRAVADAAVCGLYHCTAAGETSWYDYACQVIERARRHGLAVKVPPDGVQPLATRDYPTAAVRPLNSRLDTRRLQRTFGLTLPHWSVGVQRTLDELLAK